MTNKVNILGIVVNKSSEGYIIKFDPTEIITVDSFELCLYKINKYLERKGKFPIVVSESQLFADYNFNYPTKFGFDEIKKVRDYMSEAKSKFSEDI